MKDLALEEPLLLVSSQLRSAGVSRVSLWGVKPTLHATHFASVTLSRHYITSAGRKAN